MSKIHSQLQELRNSDPSVQLSCLLEAYFVVENSSKELGKVTSGIFDQKFKEFTCEQVTRQSFLDIVVKNFSGLIRNFKQAENPELFASAMRMEKELKGLGEKEGNLASAKLRKNDNSSPVIYCVDEIVNFINGDREEPKKVNGRKRRVSKASTADSSESPFPSTHDIQILLEEFPSTLDKEIEDFQNTLESTQPFEQKLKPSLSQEWLKNLRSQILKQ